MLRVTFTLLLLFISCCMLKCTQAKSHGSHHSSSHSSHHSSGSSHHSSSHHSSAHSYPSSSGLSGGGHSSGGLSGGHGYPSAGGGHSHPTHVHGWAGSSSHVTSSHISSTGVKYNYHYSSPSRITYYYSGSTGNYPVYVGEPPVYVYEYRDSGSAYRSLLTGLALYNLGRLQGSPNAHRHNSYHAQPHEVCKFGITKSNGDYEETKIRCEIMTSFIFEEEKEVVTNSTFEVKIEMNNTLTNETNGQKNTINNTVAVNTTYIWLDNGTVIPAVESRSVVNNNGEIKTINESVTVNVVNSTTVTDAVNVKGDEIKVTPEMQCYVIRDVVTSVSKSHMKRDVPCGLLETYTKQSLVRNSATRIVSTFTFIAPIFIFICVY